MVTIGTVCSGIGAPEKALARLGIGYEVVYFCEIDKHAEKSFCAIHNEPKSKNLVDLTAIQIDRLPHDIDLIVGGTPCQDFSIAGGRAGGEKDSQTRSSLMWWLVEIIRNTKPKVVLWENVPGCLAADMKRNYKKFISTLNEIGYKTYAKILNSKDFGVPQSRDRVFVLAIRKDLQIDFEMPCGYDCGIRLVDILESNADPKYYLSEQMIQTFERRNSIANLNFTFNPKHKDEYNKAQTITTREGNIASSNWIKEPRPIEITSKQSQGYRVYDPQGLSVTLSAEGGGLGAKTGLYMFNAYNNAEVKDFAPTQTANCGTPTSSAAVLIANETRIRKLTPLECFKLMGFDDSDFDKCKAAGISDSQLYKQAGNSIVVNVLMAIFGQLYGVDWPPLVYGKWYKTEQQRLYELPLLQAS